MNRSDTISARPAPHHTVRVTDTDITVGALGDAFNIATEAAEALQQATRDYPGDAPVWGLVDVVSAIAHLRAATRLIDGAAQRILAAEADQ